MEPVACPCPGAGLRIKKPHRHLLCSGGRLSAEDEELRSLAAAEAGGVLLSAERDLQSVAVGLYDSQLTRFNMSDTQVGAGSPPLFALHGQLASLHVHHTRAHRSFGPSQLP